jgi:hypothetical protein
MRPVSRRRRYLLNTAACLVAAVVIAAVGLALLGAVVVLLEL